jgi:MFS family permease
MTAHTLPFGGFLLLGGRIGDLIGHRRAFVVGLGVFTVGLLVAGLAPAVAALFAGRVLQGLGAALSAPAAMALINTNFPAGRARVRAFGVASLTASLGYVTGGIAGGLITATLGWRWLFLLVAPVAVATAGAARRVLVERREHGPRRLDVPGAMLGTAALVAFTFAITRLERPGAGLVTPVLLGVAVVLGVAFVWWERRAARPLLPLRLLRIRTLTAAGLGAFAYSSGYLALVFLTSLYLQRVLGLSAFRAGLGLTPLAVVSGITGMVAGRIGGRLRWTTLAAVGIGTCGVAFALLAVAAPVRGYLAVVLPAVVLFGLGGGCAWGALGVAAAVDVPEPDRGVAYGLFETHQHVGGSVMLAVVGTTVAVVDATAGLAPGTAPVAGLRAAFLVSALLAAAGVAAVLLVGRPRGS